MRADEGENLIQPRIKTKGSKQLVSENVAEKAENGGLYSGLMLIGIFVLCIRILSTLKSVTQAMLCETVDIIEKG